MMLYVTEVVAYAVGAFVVGWFCWGMGDYAGWCRGLERGFIDGWKEGAKATSESIRAQLLAQGVALHFVSPGPPIQRPN